MTVQSRLDDAPHYPIGTVLWMTDMRGVINVVVEKVTIYLSEGRVWAEHYVRPVDLPPEVKTYMGDVFWQWPKLDLLHETREAAEAAARERMRTFSEGQG